MFRDMKERLNGPKDPTDFSMTSLRFKRNNPSRIFFPSQEDLFKENNRNKMRELILRSKWIYVQDMVQERMTTKIELCGRLNNCMRYHTAFIVWRQKTREDLPCVW